MKSPNSWKPARSSKAWLSLLACVAMGLAACSGDRGGEGSEGPAGPVGPPGAPPGGGGVPVGTAQVIKSSIVSATVPADGKPVVEVRLVNELDQPLVGLPAGSIRFVLARLEPGVNGNSSSWHAITRRTETFPGTPAPTPADRVTGTGPTNQGYTETATAGTWVESSLGNGVYTYTFAQSLNGIADIPYDPSFVHRVGLEIRTSPTAIPANNAVFTWIPATGTPVAQSGREIVDNDTCNACHDNLVFHGGARFDLQYCVMCHESYSFDAQSGNSIDLKVMIHKIHSGETLPSVEAGGFYGIFGFGNTFADYSDVVYPQDKRNCQTCHEENDADTPQASNWRITVNREVCGSCHDNVNFDTGVNHGGVAATDDQCVACHGPNSNVGTLRVQSAHLIPEQEAAKDFKFEVVKVEAVQGDGSPGATTCADSAKVCTILPGEFAKVTIKVSNPNDPANPWELTDAPFTNVIPPATPGGRSTPARLRVRVAYTTQNYTSPESGNEPGQPIQIDYLAGTPPVANADGSYTKTATVAIPSGLIGGSGVVFLEGRVIAEYQGDLVETGIKSTDPTYFAVTDATPQARRSIVDVSKCDDCHQQLSFHGESRNDQTELCATCHNPELALLPDGGAVGEPFDLKVMIHAIHAGLQLGDLDFTGFAGTYPGKLNNCEGCHVPDSYYPVDPTEVFATSVNPGADDATPADDTAWTPNSAVCYSCHATDLAKLHMEQQGGSFSATKNADGTSNEAALESCGTCHGAGRISDVKVEHGVDEFNFN